MSRWNSGYGFGISYTRYGLKLTSWVVCGIETLERKDEKPVVHKVIPVAGNIGDRKLDAETVKLTPSKSKEDPGKDGLQVTLHGGEYNKIKQSVVIDFICDKERSGLETENDKAKREEKKETSKASLQFVDYTEKTDGAVLKLTWLTKQACETQNAPGGGSEDSASWGFFTWFIIMFVSPTSELSYVCLTRTSAFLGTAAYLIFGSWLNYNRYGARGYISLTEV